MACDRYTNTHQELQKNSSEYTTISDNPLLRTVRINRVDYPYNIQWESKCTIIVDNNGSICK